MATMSDEINERNLFWVKEYEYEKKK